MSESQHQSPRNHQPSMGVIAAERNQVPSICRSQATTSAIELPAVPPEVVAMAEIGLAYEDWNVGEISAFEAMRRVRTATAGLTA